MAQEKNIKHTLVFGHKDQLQTTHWKGIKEFEELFQAKAHELGQARSMLLVNFGPGSIRAATSIFPALISPDMSLETMILTVFQHLLTNFYNIKQ